MNGLGHLAESVGTRSYSPGLFTGALLWTPLDAWALRQAWHRVAAGELAVGVVAGLVIQGLVVLLAIICNRVRVS